MNKKITILGAGPGGYTAAIRGAQAGAEITLIEKNSVGGTCLNWGCIPTKAYIEGVAGNIQNLQELKNKKDSIVAQLVGGVETLIAKNKIELLRGEGKVISPREVEVSFADGTKRSVENDVLILAAGSRSIDLPIKGIDLEGVVDSKGILELGENPKSILIIGGGVIGLEFAQIFAGLGSKVTIVEMLPKILTNMDEELVRRLQPVLKKQGIEILTGTRVMEIARKDGVLSIKISGKKEETLQADLVLSAAGREPNLQGIDPGELGLIMDGKFIKVDEKMQTNLPGVFALGDLVKSPMLAHVAAYEAEVVMKGVLGLGGQADYSAVPSCVYTHPELAGVGIDESTAKERGLKYKAGKFPFSANGRALTQDAAYGMVKIIAEEESGRIIGGHILGPNASELIHELTLAVRWGLTVEQVAETIHAHPTLSEAMLEAAHGVFHKPIHSL